MTGISRAAGRRQAALPRARGVRRPRPAARLRPAGCGAPRRCRWPPRSCSRPPAPRRRIPPVEFIAGEPHVIVLRHGPPENVVFAEVSFPPTAFRRQRPAGKGGAPAASRRLRSGLSSRVCRSRSGASVTFKYARYFLAPARARAVYRQRRGVRAGARRRPAHPERPPDRAAARPPGPPPDNLRAPMPAPGTISWPPRSDRHLRRLRRARPAGRRHGAGDPPGRPRRRHAGHRIRQAAPWPLRLPARVARGRRAVGAVYLPRHRSRARSSATAAGDAPLDPREGWQPIETDSRRSSIWAGSCAGTRRWRCPDCPGSPAAPSATSATTSCVPSSHCRTAPPDDRDLPDAVMMVADTLLVLDNLYNRATVIANVEVAPEADDAELRRLYAAARRPDRRLARAGSPRRGTIRPLAHRARRRCRRPPSPYADERFQDDVRRIKEYIAAGDTFQTVLSRRLDVAAPDPFLTYRYLRALNPAPYLYYLHCDDIHVIGSSPEILVRVEDGEVTLRPIAGTRPRGATPERGRGARGGAGRRSQGAGRAPHAGRPRPERRRPGGRVRLGAAHRLHGDRALLARDAPGERGARPAPPGARRGGGARRLLPRRHRLRRAQGARDADHRRAGAGPARPLRRRGRVRRLGRAARWTPPSPSAPASCAAAAPGSRPAPGSWPTPIPAAEWRETEAKARAVLLALALAGEVGRNSSRALPAHRPPAHIPPCPVRLVSATGDQSFELPAGRIVVGRGLASDIAIYDPTISRRHAELIVAPTACRSRISAARTAPSSTARG